MEVVLVNKMSDIATCIRC